MAFAGKKRVSLLANVGTLIEPIPNKTAYLNGTVAIPKALFSHRDQIEQWQTSVPQGMQVLSGWGGRAADVIHSALEHRADRRLLHADEFLALRKRRVPDRPERGAVRHHQRAARFPSPAPAGARAVHQAKDQVLRATVASPDRGALSESLPAHPRPHHLQQHRARRAFPDELQHPGHRSTVRTSTPPSPPPDFPNHWLSDQFKAAVKTIAIRETLKLRRQTIFIEFGGWDHHTELLTNQRNMLLTLDGVLYAFQKCLETLGLADDVVTFTCSDFGRTLRSNGQGTDHAWAGNQLVMGGPVARWRDPRHVSRRSSSTARTTSAAAAASSRSSRRTSISASCCAGSASTSGDMDNGAAEHRELLRSGSGTGPVGFLA